LQKSELKNACILATCLFHPTHTTEEKSVLTPCTHNMCCSLLQQLHIVDTAAVE
jgi:hypothetical protein